MELFLLWFYDQKVSSVAFIRDLSPSCFAQLTLRELVQIKVGINNAHCIAANNFTVTLRRQEIAEVVKKLNMRNKNSFKRIYQATTIKMMDQ